MPTNPNLKVDVKVIDAPLFHAGETYFLSSRTGVPAKIFVEAVYMKSRSKEWMYLIYSEANDCKPTYVPESVLRKRISKHKSKAYEAQEVIDRIDDGYRFCSNYPDVESARAAGMKYAQMPNVASVLLFPALNYRGEPMDGFGLWIRWKCVIVDDINGANEIPIRIK